MPQLFPHQEAGVAFMRAREAAGKNWGNFDVCGMGKSFQLGRLVEGDGAGAETLLVCPASIVGQWRAVAKRFGVGDRLTVASYACVANARDAFRALAARHWHRAVFDEAHFLGQLTRDRHGQPKLSKRSVHARRIRARFLGVLTATPCTGTHESFECLADFLGMDASELAGAGSIRRRLCDVPAFARQFPWLTRVEHFRCVTQKSVAERRRAVEDYVDRNLPPPHPVTGVRKGRAAQAGGQHAGLVLAGARHQGRAGRRARRRARHQGADRPRAGAPAPAQRHPHLHDLRVGARAPRAVARGLLPGARRHHHPRPRPPE